MKAIPAEYAGHRFRSRLEARWAVFFDRIGVPWQYEPEGYAMRDSEGATVCYLPDFWMPGLKCFIEIKPTDPLPAERVKAKLLARHSGHRVFVFCGQPGFNTNDGYPEGRDFSCGAYLYTPDGGEDYHYAWCMCPVCFTFGVEFDGRSARLPCGHGVGDKSYTFDAPQLLAAYDRANQWSFW